MTAWTVTDDVGSSAAGEIAEKFISCLIREWIESSLPGSIETVQNLHSLWNDLKELPFLKAAEAVTFVHHSQRVTCVPYPPKFDAGWCLRREDSASLLTNLSIAYIYSLCAYPPSSLTSCRLACLEDKAWIDKSTGMEALLFKLCNDNLECTSQLRQTLGYLPSHMVILNHTRGEIVLIIRGSVEAADWIINLTGELSDEGTHKGMHQAAKALLAHLESALTTLCSEHPDYKLLVTGHSLGAGVASLFAVEWANMKISDRDIYVYGFACPRIMTLHEDKQIPSNCIITSVVYGRDFAPRSAFHSPALYIKFLREVIRLREQDETLARSTAKIKRANRPRGGVVVPTDTSDSVKSFGKLTKSAADQYDRLRKHEQNWRKVMAAHRVAEKTESWWWSWWSRASNSDPPSSSHMFVNLKVAFQNLSVSLPTPEDTERRLELRQKMELIHSIWRHLEENSPAMTIPGRLIQIIPKAHFIDYCQEWPQAACFLNSCLFIDWPQSAKLDFARDSLFSVESFEDHSVKGYGAALAPNLFQSLPIDFIL